MVGPADKASARLRAVNKAMVVAVAIICISIFMTAATAYGWFDSRTSANDRAEGQLEQMSADGDCTKGSASGAEGLSSDAEAVLSAEDVGEATSNGGDAPLGQAPLMAGSGPDRSDPGAGGSPVTPQASKTCVISIECASVLAALDELAPEKASSIPGNGVMLSASSIPFEDGESVFDALQRACASVGMPLEYSSSPFGGSCYVEGLNGLSEFDCGPASGWTYTVNGGFLNLSSSDCLLNDGDVIVWSYRCS